MTQNQHVDSLLSFLAVSPTSFHATANLAAMLQKADFKELVESDPWTDLKPGSYFIRRNHSSLLALVLTGENPAGTGFRMVGCHTDSPGLKLKPAALHTGHGFVRTGVEVYGGPLLATWFDRDLSLAGRVVWQDSDGFLHTSLVNFSSAVATIPSLAIHLDREANKNKTINRQNDLVPVLMLEQERQTPLRDILTAQLTRQHPGLKPATVLDFDLFLADRQPPAKIGLEEEFIASARLDNLLSCHSAVRALADTVPECNTMVILHDHEEVGSMTRAGAQGSFFSSILERIIPEPGQRQAALKRSFFISSDNAHGVHPNFADKHDPHHLPRINKGLVLKSNAAQRYATDAASAAFFRALCGMTDVPVQEFVMRSDMACGSTIGPLTSAALGVATVDVGVAQLAMHSIRELAGVRDVWYLYQVMCSFLTLSTRNNLWRSLAA
ncbi:M18 family aminopeptidase [Desulfolithobacter sp.]